MKIPTVGQCIQGGYGRSGRVRQLTADVVVEGGLAGQLRLDVSGREVALSVASAVVLLTALLRQLLLQYRNTGFAGSDPILQ